ncbi:response regulator transcription factor [Sulfurospirillum diekertiae]|uniref:Response regulator transcription factor n=1 Tax=Sulfurospirillum diekertiae TaxID=1854492 RepID=A0A6G9VSQ9_9BACT|nr:response regulator transcription factor [Sulfurospirillum diekertiae]QIR75681.1 response regulator transcription factor [Sulfurospirillum diekertiae]QIR78328.1 response regulator transcription factor [Sulfurospirillum diekertiae]
MKLLLLEDDVALNKIIKQLLEQQNYVVENFLDGYSALDKIIHSSYDIYILDINVPGFDGLQMLEFIRNQHQSLPVIIISAFSDIDNIKKAYDLGCNDYLKKPFTIEELLVRIRYLIKQRYPTQSTSTVILFGNGFGFDVEKQQLLKAGHEITLTYKEKLLLALLIQHLNQTVSIQTIREYVWDGKELEAVSIRSIIFKLQQKLSNGMIVNVRSVGYKLISMQY